MTTRRNIFQIDLEDFIANKLPSHVVVTDGQRALAELSTTSTNGPWYEGRPTVTEAFATMLGGPGAENNNCSALASLSEGMVSGMWLELCGVAGLMGRLRWCVLTVPTAKLIPNLSRSLTSVRIKSISLRLKFPRINKYR
jgi:hypothetical protein